jgi:hypothetical protein
MPDKRTKESDLESELFTPALQEAVSRARDAGFQVMDVVNGAANAYMRLLVMLLGNEQRAAEILQGQAKYLLQETDPAPKSD